MVKRLYSIFIIIQFITALLFPDNRLRLMQVQEPPEGAKRKSKLLFHLTDIEFILKDPELALSKVEAEINLYNPEGREIAQLGTVKKGKVKWLFKQLNNNFLVVKMKPPEIEAVLKEIKKKKTKTKYRLRIVNKKRAKSNELNVIKSYKLTFYPHLDLYGVLEYPLYVIPGEDLGKRVMLEVYNEGIVAAENFFVELVLSSDNQIPMKPEATSEHFSEDMLLKEGRLKVDFLGPGQSVTLGFNGPLTIPADTPPGWYHLGAVLDPENKIEEVEEGNNRLTRLISIYPPPPKRFVLNLTEIRLTYQPRKFGLELTGYGALLSDGRDWRRCRIQIHIHQLKQMGWKDFFWELNTDEQKVWNITGVDFCKKGGSSKELNLKMKVRGDRRRILPASIKLHLPEARLIYEPGTGKFLLENENFSIAHTNSWKVAQVNTQVYHVKYGLWKDFFWEVDTFRKNVRKITGGTFGQPLGTATALEIKVTVEQ